MYDLDFEIKDKYDIDDLLEVTRILRSENGCPWDREQDHKRQKQSRHSIDAFPDKAIHNA